MEIDDKINILLVDDKPENLLSLSAILTDTTYNIIKVTSGQEALKQLLNQEFAVILLDVQMPIMDGFETATFIRGRERLRHTPIIFLTANTRNETDLIKGYSLGAVDYIFKPIVPHILQSKVAVFIELYKRKQEIERLRHIEQKLYVKERAQNLEALRRSEEQYRLLFENNPQPMWVFDIDSLAFLEVNKAAVHSYGYSREEFLGMTIKEIRPVEEIPALLDKINRDKSQLSSGIVVKHRKKNGAIIDVEITSYPILFLERPSRFVLATDITEKKKIEAQFLRAQRMENIGILASGIAHDLNNVLAPMLMSVQVLRQRLKDEQSQSILSTLEMSAQRGANLVKHVLSFGRGVDGQKSFIQIKHLIAEVDKVIKETFPKSITIQTKIAEQMWLLSGDSTQIHQILMNLCINARDAMTNGGTLTLSASNFYIDENYTLMHADAQIGPYIVITVTDTGTGIPDKIIDQIFDPFFTTKELGKGTGLGLSTVKSIVKNEGGFLNVYSETGKGTQFKVFLPAVESKETRQETIDQFELPSGNGELILVVDDEASIRQISKTTLEAYNYRVITASDGIEAIARYAENKNDINLVITDMMMPSMDGPTAIRTLQKIDPSVKVIAVSGLSSRDKIVEMTSLGVTHFLTKPYTAEELLTSLRKALNQPSSVTVI